MAKYILLCIMALVGACQSTGQTPFAATLPPVQSAAVVAQPATVVPTAQPAATRTPTLPPTIPTQTRIVTNTPPPSSTPLPTETALPTLTESPTLVPTLERKEHFVFQRPIDRDKVDWLDRTYPYGWTQYGARETHHGVEFVNPRFTPVLAVAGGTVFYAGNDSQMIFGPSANYYGNLVVLAHNVASPEGLPVYTLYGHLERVEVAAGQTVQAGERIGVIGDSGIAIGPHLHFEVRVGEAQDYTATRNPDMWLYPYPKFGTLAGRVMDRDGELQTSVIVQVKSVDNLRYAFTYADDSVNGDAVWHENFTLGDLPEGEYEVIISNKDGRIFFRETVLIESAKITWLDITLNS